MSFQTQAIKYGWLALASLGVITGTTIYVLNNTRQQVKPEDIIELAIGTDERCMGLQTSDGVYPVPRPSFVRAWTDANGDNINVTNTIGWHYDRDMMVSLDGTIKSLVPYYRESETGAYLTVTGLWASLQIGDKINKFTRTPVIDGDPATYGEYPWQIYVEDLQERYKVLNSLRWASNNYMWCSNRTIYLHIIELPVEGYTASWLESGGIRKYAHISWGPPPYTNWSDTCDAAETALSVVGGGDTTPEVWYSGSKWNIIFSTEIRTRQSIFSVTNIPTNEAYGILVEARSIKQTYVPPENAETNEFSTSGAFGPENEWVTIIYQTNSLANYHESILLGASGIPERPAEPTIPYEIYPTIKGNKSEVRYSLWYGTAVDDSHWTLNGNELTNTAFGSNYVFYYCTEKYW